MLEELPQSKAFYAGLKTATGELFSEFGEGVRGQTNAARSTRVLQQRLSDYANKHKSRDFIAADVIFDLEKASGAHHVTQYLAEALGCVLIPLPQGVGPACLIEGSGQMADKLGKAMMEIGKALSDGVVTVEESDLIVRKLYALIVSAHALATQVREEAQR